MRPESTAEDLVSLVCAVPGVAGIDAGITSTLRTLDARLRRDRTTPVHYGLVVDPGARRAVVEISVGADRPVRGVVQDVQGALAGALEARVSPEVTEDGGGPWEVTVRVQSVLPGAR